MSAENVRQFARVAGELQSNGGGQIRLMPELEFTCSGRVSRWTFAGKWSANNGNGALQLQIWRQTNENHYQRVNYMDVDASSEKRSNIYTKDTTGDSLIFNAGDILGIFEPLDSQIQLYYTGMYGPTNYITHASVSLGDFFIPGNDNPVSNTPLITAEVGKLHNYHKYPLMSDDTNSLYFCILGYLPSRTQSL